MKAVFSIKQIPAVSWSSAAPLNLRPKLITLFYLNLGLVLIGFGESLLIASGAGVSPWTVLAQGLAESTSWSISFSYLIVSTSTLLLWIPLSQTPGIGTILNAILIAFIIEIALIIVPYPRSDFWQLIQAALGVIIVGVATGIYLTANLGAGPRDGLMTGLQRVTGFPIANVRIAIELSVVAVGWYLGGVVGAGTFFFAFGVGPCIAIGILLIRKLY